MPEFTRGPWKLIDYKWKDKGVGGNWSGSIENAEGEKVYAGAGSFQSINRIENARLIAAAPQLLEMLETCYRAIKSLDNDALGNVPDKSPTEQGWYIRDELLHNIAGIIRAAKGGEWWV